MRIKQLDHRAVGVGAGGVPHLDELDVGQHAIAGLDLGGRLDAGHRIDANDIAPRGPPEQAPKVAVNGSCRARCTIDDAVEELVDLTLGDRADLAAAPQRQHVAL